MHYIGLMSGTSVDGIDAVVVSVEPERRFALLASHSEPFPVETRERIEKFVSGENQHIDTFGMLDAELGDLFATAALAVLQKSGLQRSQIRAIGSHGQTVRHRPDAQRPFTLQIGNPSRIAERTDITTVADFRARDIAADGQGAPLVPAFHHWLFASPDARRAIVNIGGIANVTLLCPDADVIGFDTGPGNTLLDQWTKRHTGQQFDRNGSWAAQGASSDKLLRQLMSDPFFAAPFPKSTGREHFNLAWVEAAVAKIGALKPADVQATLVELTAVSIADALRGRPVRVNDAYFCGGGSHNTRLMQRVTQELGSANISTHTTDTLGLPVDWVEASAFAWLAHQTLEGQPGNIPSVTGAKRAVILGGIFPGRK